MPLLLEGRYLPLNRVGAGILGSTFLTEDLQSETGQRCVIEVLHSKQKFTPQQLEFVKKKFRQEAETLKFLADQHQQILPVKAAFELTVLAFSGSQLCSERTEEFFYLVREYIDGQNLAEELAQKGQYQEAEVIAILRQILPILQFAHQHNVVHGNIRLENILRDHEGQLYLTNFGAVRQSMVEAARRASIGLPTSLLDLLEQQDSQPAPPASDLYGLATTLLRLLTNQEPPAFFNPETQCWNWKAYAQVSNHLSDILDKMLESVPDQRFQSAAEVMLALDQKPTLKHQEPTLEQMPNQVPNQVLKQIPSRQRRVSQLQPLTLEDNFVRSLDKLLIEANGRLELEPAKQTSLLTKPHLAAAVEPIHPEPIETTFIENSLTDVSIEQPLPALLRQAAILGSGGWFVIAALVSFLGTVWASGLWLLILAAVVFEILAKEQPLLEKSRLLAIGSAAVGLTFLLVSQLLKGFSFVQTLPQMVLLTFASGLFALILMIVSQLIYNLVLRTTHRDGKTSL
jgi:serine/threonine protein kinase